MVKSKQQLQLDIIKGQIVKDNICPELAAQATQLVFGDGNATAEIVFIGEAPGKHEDLEGQPFVGAAGKFLDEMLNGIGLKRTDVYITNIVKYRPPSNREPLPSEKAAFLPYLQAQLEVIQPKLVVALGRHSLNCFLPDLSISRVHGQPKRIRVKAHSPKRNNANEGSGELVLVILPLYHPAAALYNGAMKQTLIDDFREIPTIIKQIKDSK